MDLRLRTYFNHVAFGVADFKIVSALGILLDLSDVRTPRDQEFSRLLNVRGEEQWPKLIGRLTRWTESHDVFIVGEAQCNAPFAIVHLYIDLAQAELFLIPSHGIRQIADSKYSSHHPKKTVATYLVSYLARLLLR